MNMHHIFVATAGTLLFSVVTSAIAADYPARPIRVIVPQSAGGSTDVMLYRIAGVDVPSNGNRPVMNS